MAHMNSSSQQTPEIYINWAVGTVNSVLVTTSCSLSLLGSLLIVLTYFLWKDIRTTSRRILVFLSIADFFVALGNLLGLWVINGDESDTYNCTAQSFVTSTANLMSYFWSVSLAVYLYITLVKMRQLTADRLMPLFHILSWLTALTINVVALAYDELGNTEDAFTGGWCWIKYDTSHSHRPRETLWMLLNGQFWLLSACLITFAIYVAIKFKMAKEMQKQNQLLDHPLKFQVIKAAEAADRKLIFIPILFFLVRIWGAVRFILFLLGLLPKGGPGQVLDTRDKILLTLQGVGDSAQGCVNCILFCLLTPKVFQHLKHVALKFYDCIRCRKCRSRASSFNFEEGLEEDTCDYYGDDDESSFADDQSALLQHEPAKSYGTT